MREMTMTGNLQLSYRTSKHMRKSFFDDFIAGFPEIAESKRWAELFDELGLCDAVCGNQAMISLAEVAGVMALITLEQQEEIEELNASGAVIVVQPQPDSWASPNTIEAMRKDN